MPGDSSLKTRRDTILFDINETVLDLSALKPKFAAAFGHEAYMGTWFSMLLHASTVCVLTQVKTNFKVLAEAMLKALTGRLGKSISPDVQHDILNAFVNLPAHADIKPALVQLRNAGYRTVAFSNSSRVMIATQIENAGLNAYFSEILSVEGAESFKPDSGTYRYNAERLSRPIEQLRLVAAHDWDTHGALSAGMQAAYIDRSGAPYHPLYRKPDIYENTMGKVIEKILEIDSRY